jgi:hypothetical protein
VIIGGTSILTPQKFTSRLASLSGGNQPRGNEVDVEVGDADSDDSSSD